MSARKDLDGYGRVPSGDPWGEGMERNCRLTAIGLWLCLALHPFAGEAGAQVRISKSSLTIDEGGEGSYEVHLDAQPSAETRVDITTTNSDVRVKPASLTFTPDDWDSARVVTVEAIQDADAEDDRATVSHSVQPPSDSQAGTASPSRAADTASSSLTVTVLDRFFPTHEINISPSSGLSIRRGRSGSYSVSLTEEPTASVSVSASSNRSDVRVSPSSLTFYIGTWNRTQSFTVSVDAGAGSTGATITHSATSADINYQGLSIDSLPITVLQPQPPAGITQPPSNTRVLVGQTKTYYSPSLRSQPTGSVTISASSQSTGTATVTGSKSFGTGNWSTARDFTVTGQNVGSTTITHDVDSSDSRYDGYGLNSTSVTVEATTITCGAAAANIPLGGSASLSWNSTNADSVTIDQGVGSVSLDSPQGGRTVTPPQPGGAETSRSTTYRFTAAGGGNPGTCSATVTVWRPPSVDGFSAAPAALRRQQSTRLTWATSHASGVSIDRGIGTVSSQGNRSVIPPQPSTAETSRATSYRLTASNPAYTGASAITATASVTVWNRPSVDSFTASPSTIDEGEDSGLKWTTTHATSVSIDQGVGSVSVDDESGNTRVSPGQSTTYTLTASNPSYSGARAATGAARVTVNSSSPPPPPPPGLTVSPTTLNLTEGSAGAYNVRLRTQPSGDVTVAVDIDSGGDSRVRKNTSSLTFTPTDWNRDQAVRVSAEEQAGSRSGQARITNTPPSSYGGSAVGVTVNVADDDTVGCGATVTPTRLTIDEGESNDGHYDVELTTRPAASVTITLDLAGDPSLSADQSSLTFTTRNWNTSQRVTIEADEDAGAADGSATIGHTASSTDEGCSGMSISSVSVNIRDNDEPPSLPAITLSSDNAGVSEPDGTATVTATVDSGAEPANGLTINLTHSGGAANGSDYRVAALTIESGATSGQAQLSVVDDSVVEGAEEIRLSAGAAGYRDSSPLSMNLTDDDSAGVTITPAQRTIGEGGSDSYEVVLTSQPSHDVTITITRSGDQDVSIEDQELTFSGADWNRAQTVTVSAAHDDDAVDDTAAFSHAVASSDGDYDGIAVSQVAVTVTDDDSAGVTITPAQRTIAEGSSDSYEVVLTSQPSHDVTITITRSGDQDVGIDDRELTFSGSEWNRAQTVTVSAAHDDDAKDDAATLSHAASSSDGDYNEIAVSQVDVIVTDDETAGVSITPTQRTVAEGSSVSYEVVLTSQPSHDVILTISRSGDQDVSIEDQELTFTGSDWNQAQTVTVSAAHDDDAVDDTATFSHAVASTDGDYNGIAVSQVAVTVTDDETAGVSITPTQLALAEEGSDSYEVVLTSQPSHDVTVTISRSGDQDLSIDDQELTFSGSDWNQAQTVTVSAAHDDDAVDDTATFSHAVASTDGDYNGIAVSQVAVTVTDDETAGVSITPTQLALAEEGSDSYEVVLTSQPSHDVTVTISRSGDQDLSIDDRELTFSGADWNQAQTVTVSAAQDDDARDDAATFSHTAASTDRDYNGAAVSDVGVTVTDDETAGVTIRPAKLAIGEGGSDSYRLVLTSQPSHDVTVTITRSGDGDIGVDDRELVFTGSDWNQAQTVTVAAVQDDDARDDAATFSHTAASTDGDYDGTTVLDVDVSVTDDETAGVSITPTELTLSEGGSGGYQVVLTSQPSHDVTITISSSGDGDLSIPDRELIFTDADWDRAQTVTVLALQDDDAVDDRGTFGHTAASSDGDYNGTTIPEVNVTANDDETANVSITPTLLTLSEGGSDDYRMVLTAQPSRDVTVTITHSGDPDVGIDENSLTFTAGNWNEPQAVTVEASPDDDAVNDTATLAHSTASSDGTYDDLILSDVRISSSDDDRAGVRITPTTLSIPEGGSRTYSVVLTSRPAHTVYLAVSSDNHDLTPSPTSLTFDPKDWNAPQTVRVQAAQDDDARDDRARFSHAASSTDPTYQGIAVDEVEIRVSDNDSAGVKVTPTRLEMPEDASTTYSVALSSRPSQPVVVALSHSGDPDISANVAQVVFEPSEWDNPGTVTVQAARDPDAVDDVATLSHTASSSDSSYDGASVAPVHIRVGDLDSAGVLVTPLSLAIDEGASRAYTVVLTSKPSQDVVVEVERRGDEDVVPGPDSLTFTVSNWNEPQAVTVRALQDPDSVDDTATLLHSTASSDEAYAGLTVSDVSVSVTDDDSAGVMVSPLELTIREGDSETFTVVLESKPSAEVRLSLSSNNNDLSPSPAWLAFRPETWSVPQEVRMPIAQDADATHEVATLSFAAASADAVYHEIPVPGVSVDITDDDSAGVKVVPNPHMSVAEGESATYTVVLLSQPMAAVAVAISSSNPRMLAAALDEVIFTQANWSVAQTVPFETFQDDNTLDENEVFSHSAQSRDPNYKSVSVTPLRVTITDRTAEELTRTLPVLLSAMSGALAESIQTAVESRFERRRQLERMKQERGWWMPTYYQDRSRHSPGFDPSGRPETGPIPSRTSFGLPLAGNAFMGTHWQPVLWGHGDYQHFDGNSSRVEFRGGLRATHLGMDLFSNRQVLTGLSFARSWGSMSYGDDREGRLAAGFNTLHPYLYWQPHRRLSLWGIGGAGRGAVDLMDPRLARAFDAEFRMWALGLRSLLTRPGKNELAFRLDGFMSDIGIDPFERLGEVHGKASRARAMLEAVHQRGGRKRSFSLKSEIGGRLDRGEAVHGAAMETGLRLGFIDNPTGLDLALQGRMLLFHDGGYRDWGAGLQASWDPGNKRRGLRMSAAASQGQEGQGVAALWDHSYAYARGRGGGLPSSPVPVSRIDSQAAYGLEVLQGKGLLTPFSRLRWTGHGKQLSFGSEFGLQPASPDTNPLNLELEGTRGKSSRGADLGVRIRMSVPF